MADMDFLYLVQWEDRFSSIISAKDIVSPIKQSYEEGELITAKYQKKTYQAVISEIHTNRKYLLQQSKLPPKHSYVFKTSNQNSAEKRSQDELPITVSSTVGSAPAKPSSLSVPATIGSAPINQSGPSLPSTFGSSPVNQSSLFVPSTVGCEPGLPVKLSPSRSKDKRKESGWEEECRSLRRKIRKLEKRIYVLEHSDKTNTPDDEQKAKDLVAHYAATDHNSVLQTLSRFIFTEEELKNCSRTGKKTIKCSGDPRPPLNHDKFSQLERLVITKTSMPKEIFLKKFENFQKVLRRK